MCAVPLRLSYPGLSGDIMNSHSQGSFQRDSAGAGHSCHHFRLHDRRAPLPIPQGNGCLNPWGKRLSAVSSVAFGAVYFAEAASKGIPAVFPQGTAYPQIVGRLRKGAV